MDQIWFLYSIGTLILIFVIYPTMLFTYFLLKMVVAFNRLFKHSSLLKFLRKQLFWNFLITAIQEAYLVFALACISNIRFPDFKTSMGTYFSTFLAFIIPVILFFYPLMITKVVKDSKNKLPRETYLERYGAAIGIYSPKNKT